MNARRITAASPLARVLVALVALALSLLALGMGATTAQAAPRMTVTGYEGAYDGQPHSATVTVEGDMEGYYVAFINMNTGEVRSENPSFTDVGSATIRVELQQSGSDDPLIQVETVTVTIEPRNVTVAVNGNTMYSYYNGLEQLFSGYSVGSISVEEIEGLDTPAYTADDFGYVDPENPPTAWGVDAAAYPMGLTAENFVNNNANFNATFEVTDGLLIIEQRPVAVTVKGNVATSQYDGTEQVVEGFTVTSVYDIWPGYDPDTGDDADGSAPSEEGEILPFFDVSSVWYNFWAVAKGTDAGTYPMSLNKLEFYCNDPNFDVTFIVTDGSLTIEPREGVELTVTGNSATYDYDGAAKTVEGYTAVSNDPLFTETDWYFDGIASVTATDPGTYAMGLAADQFSVASKNFANVKFVVTDGQLVINDPAPADKGDTDEGGADKGSTGKGDAIPKTGDDTNAALPVAAGVAGALAIAAGAALVRRQQRLS